FDGQGGGQNMTNPINSNAISASVSAINITKIVPGGTSGQQFRFTFNPPGDNNTTPFVLGDGGTKPFPNLNPGTYVVTEPGELGFRLTSIVCTSGATVTRAFATNIDTGTYTVTETGETGFELVGVDCGPGGVGSVANGTATITILQEIPDQFVACTFTNRPVAALRIHKTVVGNANGQTFDFT